MSIKKEFKEYFRELEWPDLKIGKNEISIPGGKILEWQKSEYTLNFFWRNVAENRYEKRSRPLVVFPSTFDIRKMLYKQGNKYDISLYFLFKYIIGSQKIRKIKIDSSIKNIRINRGLIEISPIKIIKIIDDSKKIFADIKTHRDAITRYFVNKIHNKYFRKKIKDVTTVKQGAFKFLIDRFNLNTKKTKKDYLDYLNQDDINAIQLFTESLIKNDVFSEEYLRILDDYFIKEKLRNIIKLGREIMSLKTPKLDTATAKEIIKKVSSGSKKIKQLEGIWQEYFRKNLLYLVFSYKKIYPKVKLRDIEGDKKYPDFIGINHYNGVDIIEIKTHLSNILVWDSSHKNFSFSSEMSKAIIQTINYIDAVVQRRFQNQEAEERITEFTEEENLYHPRGIIIISSGAKLTTMKLNDNQKERLKRDLTKLRNGLQDIEIMTFDEVLQIADDYIKNIRTPRQ
jgi:hypothetical protein